MSASTLRGKKPMIAPKLHVLGCGEAFDSVLGNNSCLLYDDGDRIPTILFDCGYQIPERLWALPRLYPDLAAVALTHFHADHAFGLAPLLVRFAEEGRVEPLGVFGPSGTAAFCGKLLDLAYPGIRQRLPFDVEFCELKDGDSLQWGGLRLSCARSRHSVLNLAIRVDGPELGISFAVSGDGQLTAATEALYQGVRVLLHEVYSVDQELSNHCNLKTLSKFVARSAIERVGITHVCRSERATLNEAFTQLKRVDPRWFLLKPGMEISFGG